MRYILSFYIPDNPALFFSIWGVTFLAMVFMTTGYYLYNDLLEAGEQIYRRVKLRFTE
jgi:hypothetical protein